VANRLAEVNVETFFILLSEMKAEVLIETLANRLKDVGIETLWETVAQTYAEVLTGYRAKKRGC